MCSPRFLYSQTVLEGKEGIDAGTTFPVTATFTEIGRIPGATVLTLSHGSVSRTHAELEQIAGDDDEDLWLLKDVGSGNGTFVKGERLVSNKRKRLTNNTEVQFGEVKCVFKVGPAATLNGDNGGRDNAEQTEEYDSDASEDLMACHPLRPVTSSPDTRVVTESGPRVGQPSSVGAASSAFEDGGLDDDEDDIGGATQVDDDGSVTEMEEDEDSGLACPSGTPTLSPSLKPQSLKRRAQTQC